MYGTTILDYSLVDISQNQAALAQITELLNLAELTLDPQLSIFVVGKAQSKIVVCAGIDTNIIKCVAIHPEFRGNNINLTLLENVISYTNSKGIFHLFLYTKPENKTFFAGCGFYPIMELPDLVVLMENTPIGIQRYCKNLMLSKNIGNKIGCIVINANPFTYGHQYLIEFAAQQCDWLHIFVVNENASLFPFEERYQLVKQGTTHIANVTVHPGSSYIISKATFPSYFIKEKALIDSAHMGIDLLIFRDYIAPSLDITHRFVGTEPYCVVTNAYNRSMDYWLQDQAVSTAPSIELIEVKRKEHHGIAISASSVRALIEQKNTQKIKELVPNATWALIEKKYM